MNTTATYPLRLAFRKHILAALSAGFASVLTMQTAWAQQVKPTAPGTPGDPVWQRMVRMSDGRMMVSDGGLALDVSFAKPAPPAGLTEIPGKVLESYMAKPQKSEYALSELTASGDGKTYASPSGLLLSTTYINYLRRVLPVRSLRFRMTGEFDPMIIVSDGKVVGVLMGVRKP